VEIKNNNTRGGKIYNVLSLFRTKRWFLILLLLVGLLSFGLISFSYGIYVYKTGQFYPIRMFAHRIIQSDYSFVKNKFDSVFSELDQFNIDIKFINIQKLRYYREKALKQNEVTNDLQVKIPATLNFNGETYKVKISLTGQTIESVRHPDKWSLSVKVSDGKTILGMKEFALLVPLARGYLTDWIAHQILISRGVIGLRTDYVDVTINGKNIGLYGIEERFDKLLLENNHFKEGIIFKIVDNNLKIYNLKKIKRNAELSEQLIKLNRFWDSFRSNDIRPNQLFDLEKFASTVVVTDLMNQKHAIFFTNMRLYFNPITSLVEPIPREWGMMQKENQKDFGALFIENSNSSIATEYHKILHDDVLFTNIFDNMDFYEFYLKEANIISKESYLDSIISYKQEEINLLLDKIYVQNPFYKFPLDILHNNQKLIRNRIHPKLPLIKIIFNKIEKDTVSLHVKNMIDMPIEIHYFKYNSKNDIIPNNRILLKSNYRLSSINKNQNVNINIGNDIDQLEFSYDSLEVYYSILGMDEIFKTIVFPIEMSENDYLKINTATQPSNINEFPFLIVNNKSKLIEFPKGQCDIEKDLIIPKDYTVSARPGSIINLINSSKIVSYSPLLFFGKKDNLIHVTSSTLDGQGIVVINSKRISELSYVRFNNLSNITEFGWNLPGAITFYESQVNINNCIFSNNIKGDDYLNIVRTDFNIINTEFININADAIDSDFSTGLIKNVNFTKIGNDAVDISGSMIKIKNVIMDKIGDKGLSAGENSELIAENLKISESEIGICSKDESVIKVLNVKLKNNNIGFTAFQKKSEFGPGKIVGQNVEMINNSIPYLIETQSNCTINGEIIEATTDKVKDDLYGVKYGKTSN